MRIIDISSENFNGMDKYPSLEPYKHEVIKDYLFGDTYSLSKFSMPMHVGTHLDAPYHYVSGGKKIEDIPLDIFYGQCSVIEVEGNIINEHTFKGIQKLEERVLLKTSNSILQMQGFSVEKNVYIDASGAQFLVDAGVKLVGIDYFSVDAVGAKEKTAHHILLEGEIVLMEGIRLERVEIGIYTLICFPLRLKNSEASPCRAILITV